MASVHANPTCVLVVDDDTQLLAILADVLKAAGYAVSTATNGRLGLEACRQSMPDLVVTDIAMPEMDGLTFIRQGKHEVPSLPFIAISGGLVDSGASLEEATVIGASAALPKPFPLADFLSVVERCCAAGHPHAHAAMAD